MLLRLHMPETAATAIATATFSPDSGEQVRSGQNATGSGRADLHEPSFEWLDPIVTRSENMAHTSSDVREKES